MKLEEQSVAIAEACGWTLHEYGDGGMFGWRAPGNKFRKSWWRPYYNESELPDYVNDLNAMHQAERSLGVRHEIFQRHLVKIVDRDSRISGFPTHYSSATAAQRAEAFLRTMDLWVEALAA